MRKLTGEWYLRKRFFGGYDVYVEVESGFFPITIFYRKIREGEEFEIYRLTNEKIKRNK
jgi:hypothetical protein|tara:strand:- start:45 stop:221 length:177 start_codon:yes stop_codon:yes gene_type:complete